MPEDYSAERPLFGGAIASTFPARFQDVSNIRQVPDHQVIEQSVVIEAGGLCAVVTTAVGQMAMSKGRQGRDAQNIVRVYVANLRPMEVGTDVLINAYEPILTKYCVVVVVRLLFSSFVF